MADIPDAYPLLAGCTGFEWDAGNAPTVAARHDVEPGECEQAFFQVPFLVAFDESHSHREPRWHALGQTAAGRLVHLVFTVRGELVRVIAARDMNRKERTHYAQAQAKPEESTEL